MSLSLRMIVFKYSNVLLFYLWPRQSPILDTCDRWDFRLQCRCLPLPLVLNKYISCPGNIWESSCATSQVCASQHDPCTHHSYCWRPNWMSSRSPYVLVYIFIIIRYGILPFNMFAHHGGLLEFNEFWYFIKTWSSILKYQSY